MAIRLDQLAAAQFGVSEAEAAALIMEGRVWMGHIPADKPGTSVKDDTVLTLREKAKKYASRSGYKLEKALDVFSLDVTGLRVCDIGASNGGFTDCLLQYGAEHVWAVDVAYGILEWRLRCDERVTVMERTNARYLTPDQVPLHPTVTVMDVSFISIKLILPVAAQLMGDEGVFYTLIKPQFEAGKDRVGKKGVVREPKVHEDVIQSIVDFAPTFGWQVQALDYSPITGPEGNIEFLAKITKKSSETEPCTPEMIHDLVARAHENMKK